MEGLNPMGQTNKTYIKIRWKHDDKEYPILLYSELDEARFEERKIEMFIDGTYGYADNKVSTRGVKLGECAVPLLSEIEKDPEFTILNTSEEEFTSLWRKIVES